MPCDDSEVEGQTDDSGSVDYFSLLLLIFFMLRYTYVHHCLSFCAFMLRRFVAWEQWEMYIVQKKWAITACFI